MVLQILQSNRQGYYTNSNDSSPHPEYLATMPGTPPKQAKQILTPENLNRPTIHYIKENRELVHIIGI